MQEQIIRHLERFVFFRTIAGANDEKQRCLDWILTTFLQPITYHLKPLSGDVAGCPYLLLSHPSPKLLFFAHIDVVPGRDEQFTLRREGLPRGAPSGAKWGDKLYARGAKDMKGATLPFLLAYREMCAAHPSEDALPPVSILLTSDEETAGPTIPTLLGVGAQSAAPLRNIPCAFTPDTGSNPGIVTEHKGVVWATLIAQGKGAHGALPWEGENPIPLLAQAIQRLQEAFPPGSDAEWQMTVTPTQLQGSDARNKVPDEAHCSLDIRYPPEDCSSPEEALKRVQDHLPTGCRLELVLSTPPLQTDPKHPMVQLVKRLAEEVTGSEVLIGREHGATDARYFGASGIPAFLYGPIGSGIHGSEEWVSLSSMLHHTEISRRLLHALSK